MVRKRIGYIFLEEGEEVKRHEKVFCFVKNLIERELQKRGELPVSSKITINRYIVLKGIEQIEKEMQK